MKCYVAICETRRGAIQATRQFSKMRGALSLCKFENLQEMMDWVGHLIPYRLRSGDIIWLTDEIRRVKTDKSYWIKSGRWTAYRWDAEANDDFPLLQELFIKQQGFDV